MPFKLSNRLRAPMLLCLLPFVTLGLLGCQTPRPPALQIHVPESLRTKCEKPAAEGVQTVGQLAGYSVRQNAAIDVCEARRAAVVAIVDGANEVVKPTRKKLFGLF